MRGRWRVVDENSIIQKINLSVHAIKTYGGVEGYFHSLFTSALDVG
jgi:hypothetical protein